MSGKVDFTVPVALLGFMICVVSIIFLYYEHDLSVREMEMNETAIQMEQDCNESGDGL